MLTARRLALIRALLPAATGLQRSRLYHLVIAATMRRAALN